MNRGPISSILSALDAWAPDPSRGLPEALFLWISRHTPLVNVDLLIRDADRRILLTWRDDEIYGSGWHLPGGIIRYKETAVTRIHATAIEELGADVDCNPVPRAIEEVIAEDREARGHFISMLYDCALITAPDEARRYCGSSPRRGQWAWHCGWPDNLLPAQSHYRRYS